MTGNWVKILLSGILFNGFVVSGWAGPVDLNRADAETIARELNGVGQARAEAIVEYREQFGEFGSADEILNVSGIGPHILEANRSNILLGDGK
ncbi:MAG: helix-hairpin-helix domain-containing protein [Gammaproteobacteria bacterium]|nr:helix-hairpin-helix domain-containing protein [Gammaproteobacteria bacterium]